ncbi:peptide chain release factor N(5)-glutamine methyltransferase [Chitinophaga pendula]|uniref:peptide chain release factor N(5)-glutamine methyltransferase n=1 Tax=Chitinophaga TaxID=79328 RepID=UPI0018E03AE0|nr:MULTISPECIES: peptide chain release factor N(5)-glutamine methyltransferase [Chitinophaga]UCJ08079.1 peptide chain release factor N(5)-glutamine methyltransferase [Chitinophaga pendula]
MQKYRFSRYFPLTINSLQAITMTIQAAFAYIIHTISPLYDNREAANIAHIVMEHITGMSRLDRVVYKDRPLEAPQQQQLETALQALLRKEPVQYVTGSSWFYGLEFTVSPDVLIPRPETEELVSWIVEELQTAGRETAHVLDIGTGSGCIPIAIKKECPSATVWAIDVSVGALEIAALNASKLQQAVHFEKVNILEETAVENLPLFDVIVSNPPYIRQEEQADMQQQVWGFEPALALFVPDQDPLLFYRHIGALAQHKLQAGGTLYFEINEAYGQEVITLLTAQGFREPTLRKDIFGKDRMVKAFR